MTPCSAITLLRAINPRAAVSDMLVSTYKRQLNAPERAPMGVPGKA
jgi:hypothetical protein